MIMQRDSLLPNCQVKALRGGQSIKMLMRGPASRSVLSLPYWFSQMMTRLDSKNKRPNKLYCDLSAKV